MQRQTFGGLRYIAGTLPLMLVIAGPIVAAEEVPAAPAPRGRGVCFQGPPGRNRGKKLAAAMHSCRMPWRRRPITRPPAGTADTSGRTIAG